MRCSYNIDLSSGRAPPSPTPILFFFQFSWQIWLNNRLASPPLLLPLTPTPPAPCLTNTRSINHCNYILTFHNFRYPDRCIEGQQYGEQCEIEINACAEFSETLCGNRGQCMISGMPARPVCECGRQIFFVSVIYTYFWRLRSNIDNSDFIISLSLIKEFLYRLIILTMQL